MLSLIVCFATSVFSIPFSFHPHYESGEIIRCHLGFIIQKKHPVFKGDCSLVHWMIVFQILTYISWVTLESMKETLLGEHKGLLWESKYKFKCQCCPNATCIEKSGLL